MDVLYRYNRVGLGIQNNLVRARKISHSVLKIIAHAP